MIWVYDLETYKHFFCAIFYNGTEWRIFTINQIKQLIDFVQDRDKVLVGFNNFTFDDCILRLICRGSVTTETIREWNNKIFDEERHERQFSDWYKDILYATTPWAFSIDIMQLWRRQERVGLKDYAIRLNFPDIMDAPYDFDEPLDDEQKGTIIKYCSNDVMVTYEMYLKSKELIGMRHALFEEYGVDVMLKHEAAIGSEIYGKFYGSTWWKVKAPSFQWASVAPLLPTILFETESCRSLLHRLEFALLINTQEDDGGLIYTDGWDESIKIGDISCKFGLGGLHSEDASGEFNEELVDADVASYYPAIIDKYNIFPKHLSDDWTAFLRNVRDRRLAAKKEDNVILSNSLKIVINAAAGQLLNPYSKFYDPAANAKMCLTGQLWMLKLIEMLQKEGAKVISCNTDGVLIRQHPSITKVCQKWMELSGFVLEFHKFIKYARVNVNSYIAIQPDGKTKLKKDFNIRHGIAEKHSQQVVPKALEAYYKSNVAPETFVNDATNLHDFLLSTKVGAKCKELKWRDQILGKHARWYIATDGSPIIGKYNKSIKIMSNGSKACVCNKLDNTLIPANLDKQHYIAEVKNIIFDIEHPKIKELQEIVSKEQWGWTRASAMVVLGAENVHRKGKGGIKCDCPHNPEHKNSYTVRWWNGRIIGSCSHHTCDCPNFNRELNLEYKKISLEITE
jgi:hypothetical protein